MNRTLILLSLIFYSISLKAQTGFKEQDGMVVIEAEHYTSQQGGWEEVEGRNAITPLISGIGTWPQNKVQVNNQLPDFKSFAAEASLAIGPIPLGFAYSLPVAKNAVYIKGKKPKPVIFLYEQGDRLKTGTAAGKRAGTFRPHQKLNENGWKMLVNTMAWAADKGGRILFIAGNSEPNADEEIFIEHLKKADFQVEMMADDDFNPGKVKDYQAVFISESVSTEHLKGKLSDLKTPLVVAEPYLYEDLGMIATNPVWQPSKGQSGNAVMLREGQQGDYLQYAIHFTRAGNYSLWLLAQGDGSESNGSVPVDLVQQKGQVKFNSAKSISISDSLSWSSKDKSGKAVQFQVEEPGWYSLVVFNGASNAAANKGNYPASRIDKIILTTQQIKPQGDLKAEMLSQEAVPEKMVFNQPFVPKQIWQEKNGFVVFEAEAVDHHPNWELRTNPEGYSGKGYLSWQGPNRTRSIEGLGGNDDYLYVRQGPQEEYLIVRVMVENEGVYRLDVRNFHYKEDGDNDAWVTSLDFRPDESDPIKRLGDSHKDGKGFTWLDWGVRPFELKKGLNELYIGGRSIDFGVDRIALYRENDEKAKSKALDLSTPVSDLATQ